MKNIIYISFLISVLSFVSSGSEKLFEPNTNTADIILNTNLEEPQHFNSAITNRLNFTKPFSISPIKCAVIFIHNYSIPSAKFLSLAQTAETKIIL